jgi:hypothetical protein
MEKYLIIDYQLAPNAEGDPVLDSLSTVILNPINPELNDSISYTDLQSTQSFEKMLVSLIQSIFTETLKFVNICLVSPSVALFT